MLIASADALINTAAQQSGKGPRKRVVHFVDVFYYLQVEHFLKTLVATSEELFTAHQHQGT